MAEAPQNGGIIAAWIRTAKPLLEVLNSLSLTPFLLIMVGLGLGVASGKLPLKPLDDLSTEHATLSTAMLRLAESQEKLIAISARMDRRTQLIDCAQLKDADLRKRCLE
jgi:hypothetical protein